MSITTPTNGLIAMKQNIAVACSVSRTSTASIRIGTISDGLTLLIRSTMRLNVAMRSWVSKPSTINDRCLQFVSLVVVGDKMCFAIWPTSKRNLATGMCECRCSDSAGISRLPGKQKMDRKFLISDRYLHQCSDIVLYWDGHTAYKKIQQFSQVFLRLEDLWRIWANHW